MAYETKNNQEAKNQNNNTNDKMSEANSVERSPNW